MLARSGPLPAGRAWASEPKLNGYRCLIDTHDGFRARSRRGWNIDAAAIPSSRRSRRTFSLTAISRVVAATAL